MFVAVHSHCDVGFTHLPSEAAAIHSKNLIRHWHISLPGAGQRGTG